MRAVGKTDVGVTRVNNEDFFILCPEHKIFVVADGMGGHNAGEVASRLACESVVKALSQKIKSGHFSWNEDIDGILDYANETILNYVKDNPNCKGMGTTLVLAYLEEQVMYLINIGDSRCYGLNGKKMIQLTKDHSLVAELVKMGSITQEEALTHPDRNVITSALGVSKQYEVYKSSFSVVDFEKFLICTDGLTNMVDLETIQNVIKNDVFDTVPERLVTLANQNGGKDNITVVCIEM